MVDALRSGIERVGEALAAGLPGQRRLTGSGIEVCDARVLSLRPEGDIEKALQTPLREQLQAEADRALYERRALAVGARAADLRQRARQQARPLPAS